MKKFALFLWLVVIVAASCKKEKYYYPEPCPPADAGLIKSVQRFYDDGSYYYENYVYDKGARLIKQEHRNQSGGLMSFQEFHYKNGLLTGVTLNSSTKKVAEYKYYYAGTLKPAKFEYLEYDANNALKLVIEQLYEYNTIGQIIKTTVNHYNNVPSYYITTSYTNGNITGQKHYSLPASTLMAEFTYGYDNKANPYYRQVSTALDNPRYCSKNNIVRITNVTAGPGTVTELTFDYEYGENSWPVKSFNKYNNGTKALGSVYTYE